MGPVLHIFAIFSGKNDGCPWIAYQMPNLMATDPPWSGRPVSRQYVGIVDYVCVYIYIHI